MPIIRGSAPTHEFWIPLKARDVEQVEVIYRQGDVEILKGTDQCEVMDNLVRVNLLQSDTFRFYDGVRSVKIQIRVKPVDNAPLFGEEIIERVVPSLFAEEM